jgi:hypothetical protein
MTERVEALKERLQRGIENWTLDKNPPAPVISRAQCRTFKISQSGREAAPEP